LGDCTGFMSAIYLVALSLAAWLALSLALMVFASRVAARGPSAAGHPLLRVLGAIGDRLRPQTFRAASATLAAPIEVVYPWAARVTGLEGHGEVEFGMDSQGRPSDVTVSSASHRLFGSAAVRSITSGVQLNRTNDSDSHQAHRVRLEFVLKTEI
jgi:outer membrane biosynthesis protein TonB